MRHARSLRHWILAGTCALATFAAAATPTFAATARYRVRANDTYWSIAHRLGLSVAALEAANPAHPASDLYAGIRLVLPTQTARDASKSPPRPVAVPSRAASVSNAGLHALAKVIVAEEGNRSYQDQVGVAAVVLNRTHHRGFPHTISGVILQRGQFTSVSNGTYWNARPTAIALRAAAAAARGYDPTRGALYFYDPGEGVSSTWIQRQPVTAVLDGTVYVR